jgi:hypothetical protein
MKELFSFELGFKFMAVTVSKVNLWTGQNKVLLKFHVRRQISKGHGSGFEPRHFLFCLHTASEFIGISYVIGYVYGLHFVSPLRNLCPGLVTAVTYGMLWAISDLNIKTHFTDV